MNKPEFFKLYCSFLKHTLLRHSMTALSEVSPFSLSHDKLSRSLNHYSFRPADLWKQVAPLVRDRRGVVLVDDTVISKKRSEEIELVRWQYSGTEHAIVKGIDVISMVFFDEAEGKYPIDYRIYNPDEDAKTKNEHFRDMLSRLKERDIQTSMVVADSWYSSLANLKAVRSQGYDWVMGLRKNRLVDRKVRLESLEIPEEGRVVHLQGYGWIRVFRFEAKNGRTDYLGTSRKDMVREECAEYMHGRWTIEVYHRELKQTCGLCRCQARAGRSQRNHIGLSILSLVEKLSADTRGTLSVYSMQWEAVKPIISQSLKTELFCT